MPDQERRLDYMPLTEVARADRNPKRHDAEGIAGSMKKFGVVELPALDERTGKLVAGHGRLDAWLAAAAREEQPPAGIKIGEDGVWLVPVIRGWASNNDAEASAYLVASNQLTINGGWDDRQLAELLDDLQSEDADLLKVTGFDGDQLDQLLSHTDAIGGPAVEFLSDLRDPFGTNQQLPPPQEPPGYDWPPQGASTVPPGESDFEPPEPGDDSGPSAPSSFPSTTYTPAGTAAQYAPMSWVLHENDRKTIRTVLTHLQKTREIPTSAEALVALCQDYMQANGLHVEDLEGAPQ